MSEEDEQGERHKHMIDRERGALTRADRELLLGTAEYETEQQRRNARYRLRKHLRNGIIDLSLVGMFIHDSELLQVKNSLQEGKDTDGTRLIEHIEGSLFELGLRSVFVEKEHTDELFSSVDEYDLSQSVQEEEYIGNVVRAALVRANRNSDCDPLREASVEVNIDRTIFDEDKFIERLVHERPTHAEFSTYLDHGDVDRLRKELKKNDETIDIESLVYTIGPDDETLIRYSSKENN